MHCYRCSVAAGFLLLLLHISAIGAEDDVEYDEMGERVFGKTKTAKQKNTKHHVSIRYNVHERDYGYGVGHYCSGSLIAPNIVLTAAHCFDNYDPKDLTVVMGSLDLLRKTKNLAFKIRSVTVHPDYEKDKFPNDIAVVYLNSSVPSSNGNIQSIGINRTPVEKGTICQVTVWPYTKNRTAASSSPQILQSVDLPVIPECKNTKYEQDRLIAPGMLCAGDNEKGGKGVCGSDTGGPLVCNGLLAGIVSFGSIGECQLPNHPGGFTQVDYFQNWIDGQISRLNKITAEEKEKTSKKKLKDGRKGGAESLSPIVASIVMGVIAAFLRM